jgi:hypothetical protein
MIRFVLNKLYLVHVKKELHEVLVARLIAHHLLSASVHKNECEDHASFFTQYIVTNIIVTYTMLLLSMLRTIYFERMQVFWLCDYRYKITTT